MKMHKICIAGLFLSLTLTACGDRMDSATEIEARERNVATLQGKTEPMNYLQQQQDLIAGEFRAVAYSGFREGQHPDRGDGAVNPTRAQISEDLDILVEHGLGLIRLYDSGENSATVLSLIQTRQLPIKVLLGIWLDAELSNHESCAWLTEPIPEATLAANTLKNRAEIRRGIELARTYEDSVIAVNVGNEALVDWNDHMVTLESMIEYVRQVKAALKQPVTVAENYVWWAEQGAPLADEVDFIGVHTYPIWEHKPIEEGLSFTQQNIEWVSNALPGKAIAILEAGWASTSFEFPEQTNENNQSRYFKELDQWAQQTSTTVFFFEAFDEPWKGDPEAPLGIEKHWGLFKVDRSPKQVILDHW